METEKTIGAVAWVDLTVPDADNIRDFYKNVVGWETMDVAMGDYNDYCMISPDDNMVRTGICHQRGVNREIPVAWMIYINVADLDASLRQVEKSGGKIIGDVRTMGASRFCIIKDPAGAYAGLFQHG